MALESTDGETGTWTSVRFSVLCPREFLLPPGHNPKLLKSVPCQSQSTSSLSGTLTLSHLEFSREPFPAGSTVTWANGGLDGKRMAIFSSVKFLLSTILKQNFFLLSENAKYVTVWFYFSLGCREAQMENFQLVWEFYALSLGSIIPL